MEELRVQQTKCQSKRGQTQLEFDAQQGDHEPQVAHNGGETRITSMSVELGDVPLLWAHESILDGR